MKAPVFVLACIISNGYLLKEGNGREISKGTILMNPSSSSEVIERMPRGESNRGDEQCTESCPDGTYGEGCRQQCSCLNGAVCDSVDGTCTCKPGWIGYSCEETCPPGTYGEGCLQDCYCQNGGTCDPVTGVCDCPVPWGGETCAKRTQCPSGWNKFESSCYLFTRQRQTWNESKNLCISLKSRLADINYQEEDSFLLQQARSSGRLAFWLGGYDFGHEGKWVWTGSNQTVTYTNWWPGEPNNYRGRDNCLIIIKRGRPDGSLRWNDHDCNDRRNAICEMSL